LYLAPVPESVQSVLDIGCGTGIWAIEFAEEHPGSQVLGIDLSPIQPNVIPSNCAFRVDDVEQHWMEDEKFDFIHSRAMIGGIKDWPRLIKTAFEHLNPGGFLELQDLCFPSRSDNPVHNAESKVVKYHHHLIEAASRLGLNFHAPLKWADQLREAGFVDIHLKWFNWPVGPWPKGKKNKLMGQWTLADFIDGSEAPIALFTRVLGWSTEEFHSFVAQCREEMKEQKMHIYVPVCFCYARKPE
jgi:SAM-dependent methyltransferase